jgi:hypothetical protein
LRLNKILFFILPSLFLRHKYPLLFPSTLTQYRSLSFTSNPTTSNHSFNPPNTYNMKVTAILVAAVMTATAYAAAVLEPEAHCRYWGQPCKREATPEAHCKYWGQPCKREADPEAHCKYWGQPCKREAEAIEEALTHCAYPEEGCSFEKRALVEREAKAVAMAIADCGTTGSACSKAKREELARSADAALAALE